MKTLLGIVVVLAVALAFAYSFAQEVPVGRVYGRVVLPETERPLPGAKIVLVPDETLSGDAEINPGQPAPPVKLRRTVTDTNGEFMLSGVPVGFYRVTAYTRAHRVDNSFVAVEEDQTARASLHLKRSQPDLQLTQQQKVFLSREAPFLPVHGYLDGEAPREKDALQVRVFRARLSTILNDEKSAAALQRVGSRWQLTTKLPEELLHPKTGAPPHFLYERSEPITGADTEGFFHQRVKLNLPGAGLYLAEIRHGTARVCGWLQISDTGLVIKKSSGQLLAYTVDMQNGMPRGGSKVLLFRSGRQLAQGLTDSRGLADFQVPASQGDVRLMAVAMRGADEDAVSSYDYDEEDNGNYTACTYTDRPLYRPGDRIEYKTIVRRALERGAKYSVPAGENVSVELRDPTGVRVLQESRVVNRFGSISGSADLSPEAPTGAYTFVTTINGEEHTQDVSVAAYRKPEYSVTVTPERKRYTVGEPAEMIVAGEYYFGAPVAGAKVHYEIYSEIDWAAEYPDDYGYDEWDAEASEGGEYDYGGYGEVVTEGDATLDETGKAIITFPTQQTHNDAQDGDEGENPQAQIFKVHVTVTDAAQREAQADGSTGVTSGDIHLSVSPEGYVATPGRATPVTITARDYDGKPISNRAVTLESGYWKWDEDNDKSQFQVIGTRRAITDDAGKATVSLTPTRSGEMRLNAEALDDKGHKVSARAYLWAASEDGEYASDYPDLAVLTDKRHYEAGETARVLINSSQVGQTALVTIEGARVYRAFTVPLREKSTFISVPVLPEYGPNVFLSACYVRDKKFARSEIPLRVHAPQREIKVAIQYDRFKHRPGDAISYKVLTTDTQGRPISCDLSFGVVDESIYALREDNPKALTDKFYPRRYNLVNTSFSFEPEYLGDADKGEPKIEARRKFLDTAFWRPNVETNARGEAIVSFQLPDNLTTWRATAVAQNGSSAFGRETKQVLVAKDFFVRLDTPRFLTQNDQTRLRAFVHNATQTSQKASVRLAASGLNIGGDATQVLTVPPGQDGQVEWPIIAGSEGEAKLRVTAWTQPDSQASTPQLTDGIEAAVPVRAHGRERITAKSGDVSRGKTQTVAAYLDKNAVQSSARLTVRVTPSPFASLRDALKYLLGYPYGCVEQTLSRFLPDILVQRLFRLSHISDSEAKQLRAELPLMVRDGLTRLYRFQHASGAWGWWENDEDNAEMTAYVLYGLSLARDEGYAVSPDVLARGRRAAAQMAAKAQGREKVFLLYALALAGDAHTAKVERAKLDAQSLKAKSLDAQAQGWLVLLDKKLGTSTDASFAALSAQAVDSGNALYWQPPAYNKNYIDGQLWDANTATATGLQALLAHDPNDARIERVLRWLMQQRTDDHWQDTFATSFVVAALCDYLQARPQEAQSGGQVLVRLNGKSWRQISLASPWQQSSDIVLRAAPATLRTGRNEVSFERSNGGSPVFFAVQLRQTVSEKELPPLSVGGLTITREYLRVVPQQVGQSRWRLHTEPTNNRLNQGDRVRVRLTIFAPRNMSYVMIEDPFPSGCEVTERGTAEASNEEWDYWWSSTDVRDDRIAFFARTLTKGKHVVEYNLRAQTPGTYTVLPSLLQAMYAPASRAESGESAVVIQ